MAQTTSNGCGLCHWLILQLAYHKRVGPQLPRAGLSYRGLPEGGREGGGVILSFTWVPRANPEAQAKPWARCSLAMTRSSVGAQLRAAALFRVAVCSKRTSRKTRWLARGAAALTTSIITREVL